MRVAKSAVFFLALLICGNSYAGWYQAGGGYAYWLGADGKHDGFLYQGYTDHYGHFQYKNLGPYQQFVQPAPVIQQPQPVPQQPQQPQYGGGQGSGQPGYGQGGYEEVDVGWRTKLLGLAAKQLEHKQYLEAIRALGVSGVYGVDSPSGSMSVYSSQYGGTVGGAAGGGAYGDLPLQQGNTVYGSLNPTYNGLADPFRNFDVGAAINQLGSLAAQTEVGSSRVRSDLAATIQQTTESYRLIRETESRITGLNETMRLFAEAMKANESKTVQITRGADGGIRVVPVDPPAGGIGPSSVPSGGPPGVPPPNGSASPPGSPPGGGLDGEAFGRLTKLISARCIDCHGGGKTNPDQKLILGRGRTPDLSKIGEKQAEKIGRRIADGSMPPGGGLPPEELAEFGRWFGSKK